MQHLIRLICLVTFLHSLPLIAADDDDARNEQAETVQNPVNSTLKQDALSMAGLKTQTLEAHQQPSEISAFATVVDLEPLLAVRQQYLSAQAQQNSASAKYRESELNLSRTRQLHDEAIVPTRRLQEQQARWQSDKADFAASGYQQQAVLGASRLQWGDVLTDWFTGNAKSAQPFLTGRAQLLLVTLPASTTIPDNTKTVYVDERGRRDHAVEAKLISAAPQVDPINQGRRYFFKLEGHTLPFGAQLTAWIANQTQQATGVLVPESAVIWHLSQAFVFIKNTDGAYVRRLLTDFSPSQGGYFTANSLQAGEEVVVSGAQTLLSQELKSQIPSEDND